MRAPPPAPALAAHHRGGAPRAPAGACSCGGLAVHQPSGAACLSLATCMRRRRRRLLRRPRCNAPSPPSSPVGAWKIEKEKRARLIKLRRPLLSPALAGRFDSHALQNATATAPRPSFEATGKKKDLFFSRPPGPPTCHSSRASRHAAAGGGWPWPWLPPALSV